MTGVSDCSLEWGEGLEIFQKVDIFVQSLGLLKLAIEVSNDYLSEIRSANIFIISLHQCFVAAFHHHHLYCGIPNFCSTWMTYEITNDISDGFFCQGRSQYCSFYTYFSCWVAYTIALPRLNCSQCRNFLLGLTRKISQKVWRHRSIILDPTWGWKLFQWLDSSRTLIYNTEILGTTKVAGTEASIQIHVYSKKINFWNIYVTYRISNLNNRKFEESFDHRYNKSMYIS